MDDGNGSIFRRYEGGEVFFSVPEWEDGRQVTQIGAKAFLSCKTIRRLELPDSVEYIGDWAFAHMKNLEEIVIPLSGLKCGKKVFLDCGRLKKITVRGSAVKNEGLPYFFASAAAVMEKEILWKPQQAADEQAHAAWMAEYDRLLEEYLEVPDEEGFEPVFIGWFHVEDMDEQIPKYVEKRQREKIRLVLQRLRYPKYLSEKGKERFQGYLSAHMQGKRLAAAVICDKEWEYCHQVCYLEILKESGCLNRENISLLMDGLQGTNPEMTAYLLRCMREEKVEDNFFSGLEL